MKHISLFTMIVAVLFSACTGGGQKAEVKKDEGMFTGAKGEVKIMTLDPGHFHAALVQKSMYDQVDPVVHVYAPEGPEVEDHMARIEGYNKRPENPTSWETVIYKGPDYLEKMLSEKRGNFMVVAGNNAE